jgi:hypothetical protein
MFIGSSLGSIVPGLWGGSFFDPSSVLLGGVGGILGIWGGFKLFSALGL